MIWHQHKSMQKVAVLAAVVHQDFHKKPGHSFRLKKTASLKCGSCDEVCARAGVASVGNCHELPQRLKPLDMENFTAALKALRHPKSKIFCGSPSLEKLDSPLQQKALI
jgi:hypothetical protein